MTRAVNNEVNINNGKSVAALFAEMKQELQDFVQTRVTMFKVELQEKVRMMKAAAPLAVIGAMLLLTAYLLFTLALVSLVFAFLPDNAYRWCIAFAAIGVLWLDSRRHCGLHGKTGTGSQRPAAQENRRSARRKTRCGFSLRSSRYERRTGGESRTARRRAAQSPAPDDLRVEGKDRRDPRATRPREKCSEHFAGVAAAAGVLALLVGYGVAGMFTRR